MLKKQVEKLLSLIKNIHENGPESLNDSEIIDGAMLTYMMAKYIEDAQGVFKDQFLKRGLNDQMNVDWDVKIQSRNGNSKTIIDTKKVFNALPLENFLNIVNVVKSKATTIDEKRAIEDASTIEPSTQKIVEIKKLSDKDKKELLKG